MNSLNRLFYIGTFFVMLMTQTKSKTLEELPVDWTSYSEDQVKLYLKEQKQIQNSSRIEALSLAKVSLINGDTRRASFFLDQIQDNSADDDGLIPIKKRYQALIAFIENHPNKSLRYLSRPELKRASAYPQICLLKTINMANGPMNGQFEKELAKCQQETQAFSNNAQFWLESLLTLKNNDRDKIKSNVFSSVDFLLSSPGILRIWLKSGIFFNQEELILKHLESLPESIYRSAEAREIIALLYYRQNNQKMARSFIEDIDSPNADNIRGNLSLDQKQYELAFGHYKLALQKKQNSLNALERSLPLAWLLGQWEDGIELLDSLIRPELDPRNKQALRVAFTYQTGDYQAAQEELNYLDRLFQFKGPLEVDQLKSLIALQTQDKASSVESSSRACKRHDGINCWISLQEMTWDNFGAAIQKDDELIKNQDYDIKSLRSPSSYEPIQEPLIINQKDIEEIDGTQVQLVPGEFY